MASDHMHGMNAEQLLSWVLQDLEGGSAFGIVKSLFFTPAQDDPFRMERYGVTLETPVGAAAGPHTQMAQNLVAAWLCGARYMELKTVQVLDKITVTKPCIDMEDEGYNCEWSQELTLDHSYEEYLKAWVLIHVLHDRLGFSGSPGMIFNMSAGYSMEGILSPTVQRFLDRMQNCAEDVAGLKKLLEPLYPRIARLDIPGCMSDNLTISCMHGCPPDEVEKIALYFLEQRRLNTTLKMNPTLLGPDCVRGILNKTLGFATDIPDLAFEHDLPYDEALRILRNCRASAQKLGLKFSVKLTNTLESTNTHQNLPDNENMVYMSGRPLHPISIALAERLQRDFGGDLDISFCAGVDALNVADTLACGLGPVTVCSDLLKPGGYGRLAQYIASIREAMQEAQARSLDELVTKRAGVADKKQAMLKNLENYSAAVIAEGSRYTKAAGGNPGVKTARPLPALDCAAAPCMSACPAGQDIPAYLELAACGDMDASLAVILNTNPFPNVLGKMCNQACRGKCMRTHYDEPLRIRDVKGCVAENGDCPPVPAAPTGRRTAVIGAGPAGLTCAFYLALAGCAVEVFESGAKAGGRVMGKMARENERITRDIEGILSLGIRLRLNHTVDAGQLAPLAQEYDAVYVATGADSGLTGAVAPGRIFHPRLPASAAAPSLVASVGEGRRASRVMLAALGLLAPAGPEHKRGALDLCGLREKQAYRAQKPAKDETDLQKEAARCLQCDRFCGICVSVCPNRANVLLASRPLSWPVQEAVRAGDKVHVFTVAQERLSQSWQVINIGDFCNECGNCAAFCPSAGAPYKDKWRLHLSASSFEADANGFFQVSPDLVKGKCQGSSWTLSRENGGYVYEDARLRAVLDEQSFAALNVELKDGCNAASLSLAVEAAVFSALVRENVALGTMQER